MKPGNTKVEIYSAVCSISSCHKNLTCSNSYSQNCWAGCWPLSHIGGTKEALMHNPLDPIRLSGCEPQGPRPSPRRSRARTVPMRSETLVARDLRSSGQEICQDETRIDMEHIDMCPGWKTAAGIELIERAGWQLPFPQQMHLWIYKVDFVSFEHDSWLDIHLKSLRVILFVGKKSSQKAFHLLARTPLGSFFIPTRSPAAHSRFWSSHA